MNLKPLKILILDNSVEEKSFGAHNLVRWALKTAPKGSTVLVRRPSGNDLPFDLEFDAMVISGALTSCLDIESPWVKGFDAFITRYVKLEKPILGVCYGHQALARCLFQMQNLPLKMGKSAKPESGWQTLHQTIPSNLFKGLPDHFVSYESHYEEVSELPPGTIQLARSDRSELQAFQLKGKPIFGIQFHPEYPVNEAEEALAKKIKKGESKDSILNPGLGQKLYDDSVGKTIFGNFFRLAQKTNA